MMVDLKAKMMAVESVVMKAERKVQQKVGKKVGSLVVK